jgi:excisionase family DNA binding protein
MFVAVLDAETAHDVKVALELLRGPKPRLSPGAAHLLRFFSCSEVITGDHPLSSEPVIPDDDPVTPLPNLLTYEECGRVLNVSTSTVRRLAKSGALATVSVLDARRVDSRDVLAYLDELRKDR